MKHKIYKITNKINGKIYIGYTCRSLKMRFNSHWYDARQKSYQSKLHRAMLKYGKASFEIKGIKSFSAKTKAFKYEKFLIKKLNTIKIGYNITLGGEGSPGNKVGLKQRKAIAAALGKKVIRDDGKIFKSISEAERRCKITNIHPCIYGRRKSAGGHTWKYFANDPTIIRDKNRKQAALNAETKRFKKRKIKCLTNGKIYPSLMAAGRELDLDFRNIQAVCKGLRNTHGNMRFKYVK